MLKIPSLTNFNQLVYWDRPSHKIKNKNIFTQLFHQLVNIYVVGHFQKQIKLSVEQAVRKSLQLVAKKENLLYYPASRARINQVDYEVEKLLFEKKKVDATFATHISASILHQLRTENARTKVSWQNFK